MDKTFFGNTPKGNISSLYTISCGGITAKVTDFGAALVSLLVPDREGRLADVVLGYDDASGYAKGTAFLGAVVGRNANRVQGAAFRLGNSTVRLTANEGANNLHSGPDCYHLRLWQVTEHTESAITLRLESPHGDQGFPGRAVIRVRYALDTTGTLTVSYEAVSDRDTVFNMTNHSYFNLAGHDRPELAMDQLLSMPARYFLPDDAQNIPTGEERSVAGTPMDFRLPKPLGQDIGRDYEPLRLQGGYDHNFEVFCNPCAILRDPHSGRTMSISTDCPGLQVYTANFLEDQGKDGVYYPRRSAVALETQFYPDCVNHPQWKQPRVRAGAFYRSRTEYRFYSADHK